MNKKIGVIGSSGRMGKLVIEVLSGSKNLEYLAGFSKESDNSQLSFVFKEADCVIDFSSKDLISDILNQCHTTPKPMVICTTGWDYDDFASQLSIISNKVPIIIAANTSLGAWLHRSLINKAYKFLNEGYDIDLIEKHHKHKLDRPSGTAKHIVRDLKQANPHHNVNVHSIRAGDIVGEHEVAFTSNEERITITHEVFNRKIFALGAVRLAEWIITQNREPGLYTIDDVYESF